jgi:hypothetical protein
MKSLVRRCASGDRRRQGINQVAIVAERSLSAINHQAVEYDACDFPRGGSGASRDWVPSTLHAVYVH